MAIDPISAAVVKSLLAAAISRANNYLNRRAGTKLAAAEYKRKFAELGETYAQHFVDKYDFVFAPVRLSQRMPLTRVYVNPNIRSVRQSLRSLTLTEVEKELFGGEPRATVGQEDGQSLAEREPHLLVLGRAGAGKTAFLRSVGLAHLRGKTKNPRIPFLIDARDFVSSGLDIIQYLARILAFGESWKNTDIFVREEILRRSAGILLWDGLDEVHSRDLLNGVISSISNIAATFPDCSQIVACRTGAYQDYLPFFREIEIAPFSSEQIKRFVCNWFVDDPPKRQLVLERIEEDGMAQQLLDSPLLLTLQCLAADEDLHEFQSRAHLFRTAVTVLLSKWDAARNVMRDQPYRELDGNSKTVLLSKIAAAGVRDSSYTWTESTLARMIVEEISRFRILSESLVDGSAILKSIEEQHGILEERAKEVWAFSHMALQEYFAALALADEYDRSQLIELIRGKIDDPAWRDVVILVMGLKYDASPLIEVMISDIRAGIRSRDIPSQLRRIESDGRYESSINPYITRSLCLWLVLHQLLQLALFVDMRLSNVTHSDRVDLSLAVRAVVQRLCNEDDIAGRLTGLYIKGGAAGKKPFSIDVVASRDRIYELLQDAIEAAKQTRPYDRGRVSQDILEYFDLRKKAPERDGFLGRWDMFRVLGGDVAWVFRKLLLCFEIVQSGVIMSPSLRQECITGLVDECLGSLSDR